MVVFASLGSVITRLANVDPLSVNGELSDETDVLLRSLIIDDNFSSNTSELVVTALIFLFDVGVVVSIFDIFSDDVGNDDSISIILEGVIDAVNILF